MNPVRQPTTLEFALMSCALNVGRVVELANNGGNTLLRYPNYGYAPLGKLYDHTWSLIGRFQRNIDPSAIGRPPVIGHDAESGDQRFGGDPRLRT